MSQEATYPFKKRLCVYTYMRIYTYTCAYAYDVCTHAYMWIDKCMFMHAYIYESMKHIDIEYRYMKNIYLCKYRQYTCMYTWMYTYMHIYPFILSVKHASHFLFYVKHLHVGHLSEECTRKSFVLCWNLLICLKSLQNLKKQEHFKACWKCFILQSVLESGGRLNPHMRI